MDGLELTLARLSGLRFGIVAVIVVAASTWLVRRSRRKQLHPDVGAVSTHWIAQHEMTKRDRAH